MICAKCKSQIPEGSIFCNLCGKKQVSEPRKHKKRANGTGSIMKLSGNRAKPWAARRNGVCIGTYPTRAEAQKALERVTDANITEKYNMTFQQVYDAWRPEHYRKVTKSQMGCYTAAFKNCEELHNLQFRKIRRSDFQNAIIKLEEAGKSKSTCDKLRQLFSLLSKWAISEDIIQVNHAQGLETAAKQLRERAIFTDEDIAKIQKSDHMASGIALILLSCGCRPNELFKALLENCHEDYFIGGSKTEAGTDRPIVISPIGLEAYRNLRRKAISSGKKKLIDGFEGNRVSSNFAKREFKELMAEIGRPDMTMYNCRHTYITNAVQSGVDQRVLQEMVGHVDKSTTKIYTHLNVDHLRQESQKIRMASTETDG